MKPVLIAIALVAVLAAVRFAVPFSLPRAAPPSAPDSARVPVIVELFTSEGCSSCPPADALLKRLSEQQGIDGALVLALEEHVDYWNQLGWKDPYSAHEFSLRQESYAGSFGNSGVYTPQMIVDGRDEFVGSRSDAARRAIRTAANSPKRSLQLQLRPGEGNQSVILEIHAGPPPSQRKSADLWIAITERDLSSRVTSGENSGETLAHAPVVRSLRKAGSAPPDRAWDHTESLPLAPEWMRSNLSVIVFLVDPRTRAVLGAAGVPLS